MIRKCSVKIVLIRKCPFLPYMEIFISFDYFPPCFSKKQETKSVCAGFLGLVSLFLWFFWGFGFFLSVCLF